MCLTEVLVDFLGGDANIIASDPDYGYGEIGQRRKVVLWSREGWRDVDRATRDVFPRGRLVAGTTSTPIGDVRVIGICIPWSGAHMSKDRKKWESHLSFLEGLQSQITDLKLPTLVLGDYNQRVPRDRTVPRHVSAALQAALTDKLTLATSGLLQPIEKPSIDHIAHSDHVVASRVGTLSNLSEDGTRISDHFGVYADLSVRSWR